MAFMARPQHQFERPPLSILTSPKGESGGEVGVEAKHDGSGELWPAELEEEQERPTWPRSTEGGQLESGRCSGKSKDA